MRNMQLFWYSCIYAVRIYAYICVYTYIHTFFRFAYACMRMRLHPGQQPKLILGFIDCLVSVSFSDPGTCGTFSFSYELDNTTLNVRRFRPRDTRKSLLFIKQLKDHSAKIEVLHFPSQDYIWDCYIVPYWILEVKPNTIFNWVMGGNWLCFS